MVFNIALIKRRENMTKYELNRNDVLEHWNDQIGFIRSSMEKFDKGAEQEAKRIASALRTLFHLTNRSKSLLAQLKLPIIFYSSGELYTPSNLVSSWTLLHMEVGPKGVYYRPNYDSSRTFFLRFEDWWNEIIFDDKKNIFTRRDIVLFVANKDGGSHVDPEIPESYAQLVRYNSLGWQAGPMGTPPKNNPVYQAIRSIGDEVTRSDDYHNVGMKNRYKQKEKDIEMRFVDSKKRYKWSNTEINKSEETQKIVEKHKRFSRTLYIQEFKNGQKVEYIG